MKIVYIQKVILLEINYGFHKKKNLVIYICTDLWGFGEIESYLNQQKYI